MDESLDAIWKALADPTRRAILDELRLGSRTTTDLVALFPDLSRFAVMKHMDVLREAGLILTKAEGRKRINSLNVIPIRMIYERWVSPFEDLWAGPLVRLKNRLEGKKESSD